MKSGVHQSAQRVLTTQFIKHADDQYDPVSGRGSAEARRTARYSVTSFGILQSETMIRWLEQSSLRSLLRQHKHTNVFSLNVLKKPLHTASSKLLTTASISLFLLLFWAFSLEAWGVCVCVCMFWAVCLCLCCLNRARRKGSVTLTLIERKN